MPANCAQGTLLQRSVSFLFGLLIICDKTAGSSPIIRPSPKDLTPKVASPTAAIPGSADSTGTLTDSSVSACLGAPISGPSRTNRFADHEQAQQPALEMSWLQDTKSAVHRNQPSCCTYELNPLLISVQVITIQPLKRTDWALFEKLLESEDQKLEPLLRAPHTHE